jgi:hypothetical protein
MVAHEVPFIGGSSFLYNWRNINIFFDEYDLKTLDEFDEFWKKRPCTLTFEDYTKIVSIGLQRKDQVVPAEKVDELIGEYVDNNSLNDLLALVYTAQLSSLVNTDIKGELPGETKVKPPRPSKNSSK